MDSILPVLGEVGFNTVSLALDCRYIIRLSRMVFLLITSKINLSGNLLDPNLARDASNHPKQQ